MKNINNFLFDPEFVEQIAKKWQAEIEMQLKLMQAPPYEALVLFSQALNNTCEELSGQIKKGKLPS